MFVNNTSGISIDRRCLPYRVPVLCLTSMLVCLQLDAYQWLAHRVAVGHISEGGASLLPSGRCALIRCIAVIVTQIPECSIADISIILRSQNICFRHLIHWISSSEACAPHTRLSIPPYFSSSSSPRWNDTAQIRPNPPSLRSPSPLLTP